MLFFLMYFLFLNVYEEKNWENKQHLEKNKEAIILVKKYYRCIVKNKHNIHVLSYLCILYLLYLAHFFF